jgi:hypothetical protein
VAATKPRFIAGCRLPCRPRPYTKMRKLRQRNNFGSLRWYKRRAAHVEVMPAHDPLRT